MPDEGGMTFAEAAAELSGSGEPAAVAAPEPTPAPEQPAQPTPVVDTAVQPDPQEQVADTSDLFEGGKVNPDELILAHPELEPLVKQLEGEWTRKTQGLAEQRKQFEAFGEPETVQQAVELYKSLQDPSYLQAFHGELTTVLTDMGLSPAEASAEAARQIQEEATPPSAPELSPELKALTESDPELAPLAEKYAALEARLQSFETQQAEREAALQEQRMEMALSQEIDQMVHTVREAHPEYKQEDMDSIFERASFFDGNVMRAAEQYEADRGRIISDYIAQKTATPAAAQPVPNAGTLSDPATEETEISLDEAHAQATAWLKANDAEDMAL